MAVTRHTLSGNLGDLIGDPTQLVDDWSYRKPVLVRAWLESNVPNGEAVVDLDTGGLVMLGEHMLQVGEDFAFSDDQVVATNSALLNWENLRYRVVAEHPNRARRSLEVFRSPWFALTGDLELNSETIWDNGAVPLAVQLQTSTLLGAIEAERAAAEAAADEAQALVLSDLGTSDGQTRALIENPASQTAGALSTSIAAQLGDVADPENVADYLTDAAAEAAVEDALAAEDIITGTDPRLPTFVYVPGVGFVVSAKDSLGRPVQTWLGHNDSDGGPTAFAKTLLGKHLTADVLYQLGIKSTPTPGVSVGLAANGVRTWLEASDTTGGPSDYAKTVAARELPGPLGVRQAVATIAGNNLYVDLIDTAQRILIRTAPGMTDARVGLGNVVTWTEGGTRWSAPLNGGDPRPANTNLAAIAMWGASTIAGGSGTNSGGHNLATDLPTLLGVTVYNGGQPGQYIEHIMVRQGSRPCTLTPTSGSIPTSGGVTVAASSMSIAPISDIGFTSAGTLAGVAGTLTKGTTDTVFTFTRTTAGAAVSIPGGALWVPTDGVGNRFNVNLFNPGNNDIGASGTVQNVLTETRKMVAWAGGLDAKFLVMGHVVADSQTPGTTGRVKKDSLNTAWKIEYGPRFIDTMGYLTSAQLWVDTGITPTTADLAAQAAGQKPPSVTFDDAHITSAGYTGLTKHIARQLVALGWYPAVLA